MDMTRQNVECEPPSSKSTLYQVSNERRKDRPCQTMGHAIKSHPDRFLREQNLNLFRPQYCRGVPNTTQEECKKECVESSPFLHNWFWQEGVRGRATEKLPNGEHKNERCAKNGGDHCSNRYPNRNLRQRVFFLLAYVSGAHHGYADPLKRRPMATSANMTTYKVDPGQSNFLHHVLKGPSCSAVSTVSSFTGW
jgi:hypothetical protein